MNVGSLFSGIGGFDLGLERAGMRTVWFCEQDDYCRRVLARHWPGVPCYPDVRSLVADTGPTRRGLHLDERPRSKSGFGEAGDVKSRGETKPLPVPVPPIDVLCGGFPCQDLSVAGKGAGLDGARSGLWSEYARLIGELRPRYVIVENVPALLARGFGRVLGDLAALGYDAEWDCLPASAFGAPHRRDRVWVVAYPSSESGGLAEHRGSGSGRESSDSREPALVRQGDGSGCAEGLAPCCRAGDVADPANERHERSLVNAEGPGCETRRAYRVGAGEPTERFARSSGWSVEPNVRGVPNGLSEGLDGGRVDVGQGLDSVARSGAGTEGLLRDLWRRLAPRFASQGRGSDEQLARELADAMPVLPHEMALGQREEAVAEAFAYLLGLRQALSSLGVVPYPSEPLAPAWVALSAEDQAWVELAMGGGCWASEWPGVGRVASGIPNRVDRLRSLGNALLPQIAEWIGRRVMEYEAREGA